MAWTKRTAKKRAPGSLTRSSGLLRFRDRTVNTKELFDACHFQSGDESIVDTDQGKFAPFFVMRDVGADECADPGRVNVRNACEVDDQGGDVFRANGSLKLKQRSENDWTLETEDSLPGHGAFEVFDT